MDFLRSSHAAGHQSSISDIFILDNTLGRMFSSPTNGPRINLKFEACIGWVDLKPDLVGFSWGVYMKGKSAFGNKCARVFVFAAIALLFASAFHLHAQTVSGTINGTVLDASGAVVANAQISITD